jgi:CRISPR type III-A-associated protein Csm2
MTDAEKPDTAGENAVTPEPTAPHESPPAASEAQPPAAEPVPAPAESAPAPAEPVPTEPTPAPVESADESPPEASSAAPTEKSEADAPPTGEAPTVAGAEAPQTAETAPDGAKESAKDGAGQAPRGGDDRKKKKRRRKKATGGDRPPQPAAGGRQFIEDQIDRDAEHLAREARSVPASRLRPLGVLAQEVRRMMASGDPRDSREARRALVLLKSKVAYLAGREQGRERSAFIKVRDVVFRGIDSMLRNRETPDPAQLRNFLDHIEAFVGYHRFHTDERRRD